MMFLMRAWLVSLMLALSSHALANAPQQAMETALAESAGAALRR
jgi:hypothetical protein